MFGLLKYRFLQICRMKEIIFWTFFFPLILGTFFKVALAEMMKAEQFQIIQTAVVIEQEDEMTEVFEDFLAELDGDVLAVEKVDADEAEMLLEEGKVRGIYYADEKITLTVAKKGISETVLQSILDSYLQNVEVFAKIAEEHPEQLEQQWNPCRIIRK